MTTLTFTTKVHAPKQKVWNTLWDDATYKQWTEVFMEGSYAETDWKEGSSILFLTPSGDGMFSVIEKNVPNEQMIFKHLGEIKKGIKEPKDWGDAKECYYLDETNGVTTLTVALNVTGEMQQYFNDTFPKALDRVKKIAES